MSRLRKPSAIALATVVLLGIPYVLLWHLSWPPLDLSWSGTLVHLRGLRLPPGLGTALLIVVLWALWGLYLAGLVVEGAARVRGTPGLLRPLGPLQVVAATAVGASVVAPAYALADTVTDEDEDAGQEAAGNGDGDGDAAPGAASAPEAEEGPSSVERERVVAGFATGSAELTEGMRADLAPVVELLRGHGDPDVPVLVTGHTDPTGDAQTNLELSERRAQAVADHLAAELGDRAPETTIEGAGSREQREGDHADQRRVELVYTVRTGPPEQAPEDADEPADAGAEDTADEGDAAGEPGEGTGDEPVALTAVSQRAGEDGGEDEERVVVLEVPDHAVTASAAFAGVLGGYVLARGGVRVPRAVLSLPRRRTPTRLALPPAPPRPTPQDEIDDRVSVELGHVPGIGLTGAGMKGAARRLLVNALDTPGSGVARVVITEEDTGWLIGEPGRELLGKHPCEPVRMVAGLPEALEVLQRELHRVSDQALSTDEPAPLVLVARPVPEHEPALSALLLHGQHRGVSAVLLGRWPLGGSCVVEEDGLITETSTPLAPIFHHSWPGSDSDEVLRAIRAHHHSRPVADTRFPPEDERAAAEPLAEPAPQPAPRRPAAEAVALSGFWDSLVENDDSEPNAFWEGVPELGTTGRSDADADPSTAEAPEPVAEAALPDDRVSAPVPGEAGTSEASPEAVDAPEGASPPDEEESAPAVRTTTEPNAEHGAAHTPEERGAEPEPASQPEPAPEPQAESAPASQPASQPEPAPEPQAESEPASQPEPAPEPQAESGPQPEPQAGSEPMDDAGWEAFAAALEPEPASGAAGRRARASETAPEAVEGSEPADGPRKRVPAASAPVAPARRPDAGPSPWRERVVESTTRNAPAPARGGANRSSAPKKPAPAARTRTQAQDQTAPSEPGEGGGTSSRQLPIRPRKAGRLRTRRTEKET